jgi:ribosome recycling factor
MEEIELMLSMTKESMENALTHLQFELTKVRTGKVTPTLLDPVKVDYYGSYVPVAQVATIKALDARSLSITPWEKNMLQPIEKAIFEANMGLTPQNDGIQIRLNIPPLTEERRKELVKSSGGHVEHAKVSIRNARRDAIEDIKKSVKDGLSEDAGKRYEAQVQAMTDDYIAKSERIFEAKEKDIMTV